MPDEDTFHAHDRLFRAGLSNPAAAAAFLIDRLPPEVAARIDWTTLKLEPGSFVDPDLRLSESDLLFSAKADGRDIGIYVLFVIHSARRHPLRRHPRHARRHLHPPRPQSRTHRPSPRQRHLGQQPPHEHLTALRLPTAHQT